MSKISSSERSPWQNFPAVIRNGAIGSLKAEPDYAKAKAGDVEAAFALVNRLLTDDTVQRIRDLIGESKPLVLPVLAEESDGRNKIPLMMAKQLADSLGLAVEVGIVQREKIGRTGTGADHRLAFPPSFDGVVKEGQKYFIVDDNLTMGGTIASLRGYVENRGGQVVGAAVMAARENSLDLAIKPKMMSAIAQKHGPLMDQFFKETFGYGIDKLTQNEAGHLRTAPSVDAIRDRILAARDERGQRLDRYKDEATRGTEQNTRTLTEPDPTVRVTAAMKVLQEAIKNLPPEKQSDIVGQFQAKMQHPENVAKLPTPQKLVQGQSSHKASPAPAQDRGGKDRDN